MFTKAIHLDMKAMIPRADFALELLNILAEQGVNAILLEFEDKFPFETTPAMHHKSAWSKDEFRAFAAHAKKCGIEIIPLMQSIGHLDYLLKHPEYSHLRDGGGGSTTYQWCLADEKSYELWQAMTDEILEVFPETKTFHIGADECRMKVTCERCGANKLDFYVKRVARCAEYIQSKGLKALIWDDVFRKHGIEHAAKLPQGIVYCVWMYRDWDFDRNFIEKIAQQGLEIWGASNLQAKRNYYAMAPHEPKMNNIEDWGTVHADHPEFTGNIGTIWGKDQCLSPYNSTLAQSMFMTAFFAETLTNGVIKDRRKFTNEYCTKFFGVELDYYKLVRFFNYEPDSAGRILVKLKEQAVYHREIVDIWCAFNDIDKLLAYIDMCFSNNYASIDSYRRGEVPPELTNNWQDGVRITAERVKELYETLTPVMTRYFYLDQWDEFWSQRFTAKLEQNEYWGKVIAEAAEKWQQNINSNK